MKVNGVQNSFELLTSPDENKEQEIVQISWVNRADNCLLMADNVKSSRGYYMFT